MNIFENFKRKKLIKELKELNGQKIILLGQTPDGLYYLETDLSIDEIKFPNSITNEVHLYDDGEGLQIFLFNSKQEKIAIMSCKKEKEKVIQLHEEKEKENAEKEQQKINEKKKEKEKKVKWQNEINKLTEAKFQAYKKFLIENGANEIIIEMPAIKELIKDILIDTYYRPEN